MFRLMKYLSYWIITWAMLSSSLHSLAQDRMQRKAIQDSPTAYALFNAEGEPQSWGQIMDAVATTDVVCFGELHDDAIMHWLQVEMVRDLLDRGLQPVLGAEMLEADDQLILDEFLTGIANEDKFNAAANLWPNHFTDYHPLLELAKEHQLEVVATNVPRRYASLVYREGLKGLAQLSEEAKAYLPPLPIPFDLDLPGYQAMMAMGGGHAGETLPMAQAIKDATMAYFISSHLPEDAPFIHFNGAYHSQDWEGIVWYLKAYLPELKVLTLHGTTQNQVLKPDSTALNRGDFLLITHERITRTH